MCIVKQPDNFDNKLEHYYYIQTLMLSLFYLNNGCPYVGVEVFTKCPVEDVRP